MFIYGILRNNLRISEDKANELAKVLHDEVEKEKEKVRQEYIKKMEEQAARYEKTIEDMKNESLDAMIRRIAEETVKKSVKENLTVESYIEDRSVRSHLEWNGEEF
jgi:translation initiation factor 2B subunit (eIF-2B alpha/beta/delta family)